MLHGRTAAVRSLGVVGADIQEAVVDSGDSRTEVVGEMAKAVRSYDTAHDRDILVAHSYSHLEEVVAAEDVVGLAVGHISL
jgi:hypothetical protein